jgi:hypothetical protein
MAVFYAAAAQIGAWLAKRSGRSAAAGAMLGIAAAYKLLDVANRNAAGHHERSQRD